jgi:ribonucleoside-diphosphate reductase alpha chain
MCHNAVHKVERKFGDPYSHRYVSFDPIKSITLVGREMVFDLQMEGPNHNFVANGFVSHNSGPIPLMRSINEIGRNVCQGGSRRSAIYGSLNWQHEDANDFISAKDWHNMPIGKNGYTVWDAKSDDFNFNAPLDMTNISLNYDDQWLSKINSGELPEMYLKNIRQALMTGEPGMSFNFGDKKNETLRNACCELTSEDDSDVCNLGSINIGSIESMEEFKSIIAVASKFLICGTVRGQLPYEKVHDVRSKNRRIGLGLMGIHEWLLKRNYRYEFNQELHDWFAAYRDESESSANEHCDRLYLNRPKGYRAIAPTGTIAILASTTSGIEPLFAVAYKRRYLVNSTQWRHEFVVDAVAEVLVKEGINPDVIETSADLANDPERRIKFQYDAQQYVDHAISSTINLPEWGSDGNNEDKVVGFAKTLAKYAHGLRGFTCYPDGSRGGQPITTVPYSEAIQNSGLIFEENSSCKDGVCGI